MRVKLKSVTVLITCALFSSSHGHTINQPSSAFPSNHRQRSTRPKFSDYLTSDAMSQLYLQPQPVTVTSSASDQHFQWWETGSPELVQSGWYGFNRFSPRTARNMRGDDRKSRTTYLLGESTQMYPQPMKFQNQHSENQAIFQLLRELQRNIHPVPRQSYIEPRIIMIDDAVDLPPGILVPVRHPRYQQHFQNQQQPRKDLRSESAKYHQRQMPPAPLPVTIKVIPLKITSADIASALKSMSFTPFPLDLMQNNGNDEDSNSHITYDDKRASEDEESDLPPPSSHVAMPMDNPGLGITYADSQRLEHSLNKFHPRRQFNNQK